MKNREGVKGGEEAGGIQGQPGARGGGEGTEEEDTKWAAGDKRFEDEGGTGVQHKQRGATLYKGVIQIGEAPEESHSVTRRDTAGGSSKNESCQEL